MEKQFLDHINHHKLCTPSDTVLLAVSGGIDSMVMVDLFHKSPFKIAIAHCNFQLRGKDSEADEALVEHVSKTLGVPFHVTRFETTKYAHEKALSIQVAARELRYAWFDELIKRCNYDYLATAHQLNDSIETILLNFVRGTGLEGMTGIPVQRDRVIRPILFATRAMITAYASEHKLVWREDSSNADNKYHRNLIRNKIIPLLKEINPTLEQNIGNTLERLQGSWELIKSVLEEFRLKAVRQEGDRIFIKKRNLQQHSQGSLLLWELVKNLGFNFDQCADITGAQHQVGKVYYTGSHQLTIDREYILVDKRDAHASFAVTIDTYTEKVTAGDVTLIFRLIKREDFILKMDSRIAQLDAETVKFPITWRSWKQGDHFVPLGMDGAKKISDFLVDEKVPLPDKEGITVVESAGEIVWLIGNRISNIHRVTDETKIVLIIESSASSGRL